MKLLLIARPSAHRNEVSAFLAQRGAEVEVRSVADPSALQGPDPVDAVVVLDGEGNGGDEPGSWPPDVPVIRWLHPTSPFAERGVTTFPASGLQELAFRVAQAAHGTVSAAASPAGIRRPYPRRAGSAQGADAA